jgi:YggT family protein
MEIGLLLLLSASVYFLKIYFLMLIARILLYWFPNISFYDQPFYSLVRVTDPYLRLFRNILPIFLGMDLSPLLAFLLIQIAMEAIPKISASI